MIAYVLSFIMLIVLDTNILYQALRSKNGASHIILKMIRNQEISLAISIPVFSEYEDVLKRKETLYDLDLLPADIDKVLDFIAYIGKPFDIYYLQRPNLRDESDNKFIELAVASNSEYILTRNINDYIIDNQLKYDDLKIVNPADFIKLWR